MSGPRVALAALLLALAGGCGYSAGLAPRLESGTPATTIGIELFGNESPVPDLERDLHVAMSAAVRSWVDADLVRPDEARVVVRGRIRDTLRRSGVRNANNELLETREVVVVDAVLWDRVAGRELGRTTARARVGTTLDRAAAEPEARARALELAAERVVLVLLAGGGGPAAAEEAEE